MKHLVFADHANSRSMLCVPGKAHVTLLARWVNDPEVRQFLLRFSPLMLEGESEWLSRMSAGLTGRNAFTDAMLLIVDKKSNRPIGTIGLHQVDWKNRHAITGTLIGEKELWGQGYGTDAKMLLLNWAFNELGLNSIESRVIEFNERSAAYSKKCGYEKAGCLRERHFRNGRYYDELIFEVLAGPWQELWKKFENKTFYSKAKPTDRDRGYLLPG